MSPERSNKSKIYADLQASRTSYGMSKILVIAKNTFRQTIRDKILYGIFIFGLLFIGSTVVLGSLALEDSVFIIRNLGLAGIYIFSLIITIFLASSLIYS